jgi:hypothetical protein
MINHARESGSFTASLAKAVVNFGESEGAHWRSVLLSVSGRFPTALWVLENTTQLVYSLRSSDFLCSHSRALSAVTRRDYHTLRPQDGTTVVLPLLLVLHAEDGCASQYSVSTHIVKLCVSFPGLPIWSLRQGVDLDHQLVAVRTHGGGLLHGKPH